MSRKLWTNLSLVILLLALAAGFTAAAAYFINLPKTIPLHETLIIGQNTFHPASPVGMRILVRDSQTTAPLPRAQVSLSLNPKAGGATSRLFEGNTDASGTINVSFKLPPQAEGEQTLTVQTRSTLGTDTVQKTITIQREARILISTDKPIYQPGQIIHLRALALSAFDLTPIANQPLEITIADGKGNKIYRKTFTTTAYGSASLDFQLASEVNTGAYKISARLQETVSEKTVTVETYTLPKFAIKLQADRTFYQPGQRVKGTIQADYFFGKPVGNSNVRIEGFTFDVQRATAFTLDGKTNPEGFYTFEFDLPRFIAGSELDKGSARFYVQASVTDQTNHTENSNLSLLVSQSALLIQAIPEAGSLRPNVENILYILTSKPDGSPVEASLNVKFQAAGGGIVTQTGPYGLAEVRYTPNAVQQRITIEARDKQGSSTAKTFTFNISGNSAETILLRPHKPFYQVGETMTLTLLSTRLSGTVYLDIIRQQQTISTRSVELANGRAEVMVDVTPDMAGSLEIHAYKILASGAIERDTRMVVVDNASALRINLTPGQTTYRPGDQGTLAVQVQGADGKAVQSALNLAVVDESVFALAEQDPGFARLYFMLEKELLQPKFDLHGYTLLNLMTNSLPKNEPILEQSVHQAAQASLAAAPRTAAFTLNVNSRTENIKKANEQRNQAFRSLGNTAGTAALLLPLAILFLAGWDSLRRKNLGRSLLLTAFTIYTLLVLMLLAPMPNPQMNYSLPQRLSVMINSLLAGSAMPFIFIASLAVLGLITLVVLSIVRKDLPLGWTLGLLVLYLAAAAGVIFASTISSGARLNPTFLGVILIAFFIIPFAFLLRTCSAALHRKPVLALASLAVSIFWIAGMLPVGASFFSSASAPVPAGGVEGLQPFRDAAAPAMRLGATPAPTPAAMPTRSAETEKSTSGGVNAAPAEPPRLRQYFPETMLWIPEAVTNSSGSLNVPLPIADSITTWRVTALASSQDGRLGSATGALHVFQDFFIDLDLPLSLTVEDQISLPVGIFNYLSTPQQVRLEVSPAPWFELLEPAVKEITVQPNEISVAYFRIRAAAFGRQAFKVTAYGSKMSDAIQKEVTVYPNGKQVTFTQADRLTPGKTTVQSIKLPPAAIPGTQKLSVKIYPGMFSQLVEGLESILRMPNGCFEQTSSTTYPNVLVLDYLKSTNQVAPEVQMKAEQYINLGYQRLATFEVKSSGGFSLFGNEPADRMLTAYGLQEFSDMNRVHPVDAELLKRAARYLASQQDADGSWKNDRGLVHESTWKNLGNDKLPVTAYIVWSLVDAGFAGETSAKNGLAYLRANHTQAQDPYALALLANALAAADLKTGGGISALTDEVLNRLAGMALRDGEHVFWKSNVATFMGSKGNVGSIETTALAVLAMQRADRHPSLVNPAFSFLIKQKDNFGTWHNTQATVLTLKALLQSIRSGAENSEATALISLNGEQAKTVKITPQNFDVVQIINFDGLNPGAENELQIKVEGKGNLMYQVSGSYYLPWSSLPEYRDVLPRQDDVQIDVRYDRSQLAVNETVAVTVSVRLNNPGARAESGLIDLGLPPGFAVEGEDLANLVETFRKLGSKYTGAAVQRYELTGRQILIYVTNLTADAPLTFSYHLRARFPLAVSTPASTVYDYYNPTIAGENAPQMLTVKP